jgi:prepilin-type processing-associated H-X9-DG protein
MNSVGLNWSTDYQVDDGTVANPTGGRRYPLPDLTVFGRHGVGIYWEDDQATTPVADWDALGYKTSIVKDPSRNLLLVENPQGQQCDGNQWTCCCLAPSSPGVMQSDLTQICSNSPPQDPVTPMANSQNQGMLLYKAHAYRFNYVFCDSHVQALKMEQTIGSGTLTSPLGMWVANGTVY